MYEGTVFSIPISSENHWNIWTSQENNLMFAEFGWCNCQKCIIRLYLLYDFFATFLNSALKSELPENAAMIFPNSIAMAGIEPTSRQLSCTMTFEGRSTDWATKLRQCCDSLELPEPLMIYKKDDKSHYLTELGPYSKL